MDSTKCMKKWDFMSFLHLKTEEESPKFFEVSRLICLDTKSVRFSQQLRIKKKSYPIVIVYQNHWHMPKSWQYTSNKKVFLRDNMLWIDSIKKLNNIVTNLFSPSIPQQLVMDRVLELYKANSLEQFVSLKRWNKRCNRLIFQQV